MSASLLRLGGWRSVGALVVVAAAATGIGQTGAGHALLEKAGLTQRPAGYTALYFGKPTQAQPVMIKLAGKSVSYTLTFFVRNAQPTSRGYRWSTRLVQRPGHPQPLRSGSATVGPGKTVSIPQNGKFTCERDRPVEFIVQLAGQGTREAIHAWATCRRPRR